LGCRSQDPVQAFKPTSRVSFVDGTTVVEVRDYKGMNRGRGGIWGNGAELPKLPVVAAEK